MRIILLNQVNFYLVSGPVFSSTYLQLILHMIISPIISTIFPSGIDHRSGRMWLELIDQQEHSVINKTVMSLRQSTH